MNIKLNYKKVGEGEPLLIIHGLFGSLDNWKTMAGQFSDNGFAVYIIDLRNHGKSAHTNEMNHEVMANDIVQFIADHNLSAVNIIGHSLGGKVAMQLALNHPTMIKKLVIVDIAPKSYTPRHDLYFDAMMSLDLSAVSSRSDASDQLGQKINNEVILQFLLKNIERTSEGYQWKFNLPVLYQNYTHLIQRVTADNEFEQPTLFIGGQLSDYITQGDYAEIKDLFPNAKIISIAGSGHWVHAEKPVEFRETVIEFLNNSN